MTISIFLLTFVRQRGRIKGMDRMHTHDIDIVDVSEHHVKLPIEIPISIVHWLREHDLKDLKKMLLEMHNDGEDITQYSMVLEELEQLQRTMKLKGDIPAYEDELNPNQYVEEEIEEAFG